MNLYEQIKHFFEKDFSGLATFVFLDSAQVARIVPRPGIITAPHLADYAPRLGVSGGLLTNSLGTTQTIQFFAEYPNPVQPEPHLIVDIYTSDDGTTFTVEATTPYDNLPISVTTDKQYILGVIRTDEATPKILFTTNDIAKGYLPLDVRKNAADLLTYNYSGNTLKGTFPIFFDNASNALIIDFDYRGIASFSDSALSYVSGDAIKVKSWDDSLGQLVLVGNYQSGSYVLPKENLFPVGSTKLINGDTVTRTVELKTLVDTLIFLAVQRALTGNSDEFDTLWNSFTALTTETTTELFFSMYGTDGTVADQTVDIAANAYLALRFLSSQVSELVDFITVPSGGQTFLDKLSDVVSVADGYLLHDSYDGTNYANSFRGFTEGVFYLLARLVEKEYPSLVPVNFDSVQTLHSILQYVDVPNSYVYTSKKELDGDATAPERASLDLAGLFAAINSVPVTSTEDYSAHAALIKSVLLTFKVHNLIGIPQNTDPNSADYNPYWVVAPPLVGFKYANSNAEIDTKISLLLYALTGDVALKPELGGMKTDSGILYTDKANTTDNKYIVPNLHSTVLSALIQAAQQFVKTTTYTVQVLDNLPNNVSVVQLPTDQGVTLDITLDYPSGIVVLAVGNVSGTTFDSVIVTTETTTHQVYLRIPYVTESVNLHILPIRPTSVT